MTTQSTTPATDEQLETFRAACETVARAAFDAKFPTATHPHMARYRPALTLERGRVWAKLIREDGGRSVFGFVHVASGLVYKAASWKQPAKNFPRGHISEGAKASWEYGIA